MDAPSTDTLTLAGILGAALLVEMRLLRRNLEILLPALAERTRRRDNRERRRRESVQPRSRSVPVYEADEENTDMHELIELERQRRRRTERPPRPGTKADKPYEED